MRLFNIQHMCTGDGPGIRTTVFFQGCPLRCIWCHNPEGKHFQPQLSYLSHLCIHCNACEAACKYGVHISKNGEKALLRENCIQCGACAKICPTGALEMLGKEWSIEEILAEIDLDSLFYGTRGGVTLSGGEPFAQEKELFALLKALKEKRFNVCIETCGYTSPENIQKACQYTDIFLFDYKETDPALHQTFTGVDPTPILQNLNTLDHENATVILRCPMILDCNMREAHYEGIAALAKSHDCIKHIELMPYHPLGIGKAAQIGDCPDYDNPIFLNKEALLDVAQMIQRICEKPVRIR